ncbi:MAG TPA: aminotransferase class IV [Chitinophagaceae bacterium]
MAFLFYFEPMNYTCVNAKLFPADQPVLMADNRGYRYGDGLFETMKLVNGTIQLSNFHFERLFASMELLKFDIPGLLNAEKLHQDIIQLCYKNKCEKLARIRLSVFRGNGGLNDGDKTPAYIIECWPLNESFNQLNENGLVIGIYPEAKKSCDIFSNLKSSNYLPYTMAAQFAKENKWNDAIVLNQYGRVADMSIANIFIIKEDTVITPALSEGGVKGVMRRYLVEQLRSVGYEVREEAITVHDINHADEVFLTNAIFGIRWVKQFNDKIYPSVKTVKIFNQLIKTISA